MRKIILLLLLVISVFSYDWDDTESGLCIGGEPTCPTIRQKYGICCVKYTNKINAVPKYYLNFCLGCQDNCEEWKLLPTASAKC